MIVCADDYGLREDINRAILDLVQLRKVSAVSCLVALEQCTPAAMAELCARGSDIDIGLHLCLTDEGLPLSSSLGRRGPARVLPSFGKLLCNALMGQVGSKDVQAEVAQQYELFERKCGRKPDFIDGHLHLHQLPGARQGLFQFVSSLRSYGRPYVRNTQFPGHELRRRRLPWLKAGLIGIFGARLAREWRAAGLPTNNGFAGIYDFRNSNRYAGYFEHFAACLASPNGILVVHPGSDERWRAEELRVLRQFNFAPGQPHRFHSTLHFATSAIPCAR